MFSSRNSAVIGAGLVFAVALWGGNNVGTKWLVASWPTSRVLLFNNLIPVSTMTWAYFCLGETVTRTFWLAMILIATGVMLGQTDSRQKAMPEHGGTVEGVTE